ncbi:MAG: DUF1848 family protein [Paludibacteraceae bacterium]|nr:DUF1848 family protein [Paludibacteraceae bacterium]
MPNKTAIKASSGKLINASAPLILSASRSTDIPAFYAQWFINRLREDIFFQIRIFISKHIFSVKKLRKET